MPLLLLATLRPYSRLGGVAPYRLSAPVGAQRGPVSPHPPPLIGLWLLAVPLRLLATLRPYSRLGDVAPYRLIRLWGRSVAPYRLIRLWGHSVAPYRLGPRL